MCNTKSRVIENIFEILKGLFWFPMYAQQKNKNVIFHLTKMDTSINIDRNYK